MDATYTIETSADTAEAYAVVADLAGYGSWLRRSSSYLGTEVQSTTGASLVGTRYADRTALGLVKGAVTDAEAGRRIRFLQSLEDQALQIDITYEFEEIPTGTRISRTGVIQTSGRLRPLAWVLVPLIRAENRRTLRALRRHLDGLSDARESRSGTR